MEKINSEIEKSYFAVGVIWTTEVIVTSKTFITETPGCGFINQVAATNPFIFIYLPPGGGNNNNNRFNGTKQDVQRLRFFDKH